MEDLQDLIDRNIQGLDGESSFGDEEDEEEVVGDDGEDVID